MAWISQSGCDRSGSSDVAPSAAQPTAIEATAIERMDAAIETGDWARADEFAKQALLLRPDDADLVTRVATVAAFSNRKREAASLLVEAAEIAQYQPASRVQFAVQALIDVGEVYEAIELLEASLRANPGDHAQRRMLVTFLNEIQRTDLTSGHLQTLIAARQFDLPLLLTTTETSSRRLSDATSTRLLDRNPDDHRVRLAEAFVLLYRRDASAAARVLGDILQHHPGFEPAQAMLGRALAADSRWAELQDWINDVGPGTRDFADYWRTLGDIASHDAADAEAARAYWEATRRDPNDLVAWERLRQSLQQLGDVDKSTRDAIMAHSSQLLTLRERFNDFTARGSDRQSAATDVAQSLFALGRIWEAEAWSAIATTLVKDPSDELAGLRREITAKLRRESAWLAADTPALAIDLSRLPLPKLGSVVATSLARETRPLIPRVDSHQHLRLSHASGSWGLGSVGGGNNPTDARLAALIRSTGVGVGSIDYDLDGGVDLVVINAGGTMLKTDSMPNELMRNLGDTFVRVTASSRLGDRGFGQGVAVGDFNEDGFPDVFVANLGLNRLYCNNGDGTFNDCTARVETSRPEAWSTSAAFADINDDAIADLVVTNYCQLVPSLSEPCLNDQGVDGPCHPLKFPADIDQFFVATPDSRLVDVTEKSVGPIAGRGLGLVAGRLSAEDFGIFVANDMSRNSFYTAREGDAWRLTDNALARGVAVDAHSQPQASMGIAARDFDRDGDLDFYVTGFAREYNVYYEQISPGMWADQTSKLGLVEPTLMMVGFGTQAIDLDNDGLDEIIVTNGHIGDFADPEAPPYEQPLQLFRRGPESKFVLIDDDAWDDYFASAHVGRALMVADVNRDGRTDVVITHADESLGLLVNETVSSDNAIAFQLVGTRCSRDGVGAVVQFEVDGEPQTLWSLAGSGYFCSNERLLHAGLGNAERVTNVRVTWQDGSSERFGSCQAGAVYLIVQGEPEAMEMTRFRP